MQVVFLGVRGSVCAPGREFVRYGGNTSCLAVSTAPGEPPTLLLDAGTGIRTATAMLDGHPFRGTILVSHLHWDHVQGLPFFSAGDRAGARARMLVPAQGGRTGRDLVAQMMSPFASSRDAPIFPSSSASFAADSVGSGYVPPRSPPAGPEGAPPPPPPLPPGFLPRTII